MLVKISVSLPCFPSSHQWNDWDKLSQHLFSLIFLVFYYDFKFKLNPANVCFSWLFLVYIKTLDGVWIEKRKNQSEQSNKSVSWSGGNSLRYDQSLNVRSLVTLAPSLGGISFFLQFNLEFIMMFPINYPKHFKMYMYWVRSDNFCETKQVILCVRPSKRKA